MVRVLQDRYGIPARDGQDGQEGRSDGKQGQKQQAGPDGQEAKPEQVGFAWART
jgi:hypothetical protein